MRPTKNNPATLQQVTDHALIFSGNYGDQFRVTVLENDLIRVQHFPDGKSRLDRTWMVVGKDGDVPREGRNREDLSPFSLPEFSHQAEDNKITLQTGKLTLEIALHDFQIRWYDQDRSLFAADTTSRAYAFDRAGQTVFHYMQRRSDEHYYGFGERAGLLDKHGSRMRMHNLDALGYNAETTDPLYKHFPFYITFIPELNTFYGLFYDNLASCVFDMGQEIDAYQGYYRYYQADDGDIDYYLIYGSTLEAVLEKFAHLTGRMILPPRWSLGYLGSTMVYTEAPDAQEQLKKFVDLCQQHDIPCDLFHLSSGYSTDPQNGKRYFFVWNTQKVPDPKGMVDYFHDGGINLCANIKPYFLTTHPYFEEVKKSGGFIQSADGDEPELALLWSGGVLESDNGAYIDFTHPAGYDWWKGQVKKALLDYGIDSTWNDNNEYEIWDDAARCDGFGNPIPLGLIRPIQTMLMTRSSYEAQLESRPDQRPFVLCRSGSPGIQRYAQTWSGDNFTSWHTLRYNLPMGLGMSLSGAPNTGHDVGGFYGAKPNPELFLRWVQSGIFQPRFTIHSFNTDGTVNEPWMYPEILPQVREAIEFRYRLIPYLYSLFFETSQTGHPMMRPLVYDFADDPRCHTESFNFMLGKNLLVVPVLEPGARSVEAYLPAGTDWCDFYTGTWYEGGQTVTLDAPLERIPLLVRAGGIIPMGKIMRHIGEQPDDLRQLYLFPHRGSGRGDFTLIEDDGVSLGYQKGEFSQVKCELIAEPDQIALNIKTEGNFPLPYADFEIVLPAGEKRSVTVNRA